MAASNLPSQPTSFIGRQDELTEITRLLTETACRLLTLIGPGGIGKTRLAIEAARLTGTVAQDSLFTNGIYHVALQPLNSSDFIVPTLAESLHFQFYPGGEPTQQLFDYLSEKSILLVLDNFEHLLDSTGLVSDLLAYAPAIKILVTSRERLNLVEEYVLNVDGLPVPSAEAKLEIGEYAAIQLFLQSAQRVQVGFKLTDDRKPAVTNICRLVGGMPLGIELAAAWVRVLSCEEIAAEIGHSQDILATPSRNVPPRHRTMRAVLEQSWNLLTDDERDVFKKLSVFRGGFRKEAARDVAGASLQTLSALVDKSLLVNTNGRYDVHELLRQYAHEKLVAISEDNEQTLHLHSTFYAEFMYQNEARLKGGGQYEAMQEIELEIDNVRTAWRWAVSHGDFLKIEKCLWGLLWHYEMQGRFSEAEETFGQAIQVLEGPTNNDLKNRALGQLYAYQAWFCVGLSYFEKGQGLLQTSLAILRRLSAQRETAFTLVCLASTDVYLGDYEEAVECLREGTALYREMEDRYGLAWALDHQAKLSRGLERYDEAKQLAQESVALFKDLGEDFTLADALTHLGQTVQELGDLGEAKRLFIESYEIANKFKYPNPRVVGDSLVCLAGVCHALGEDDQAVMYFQQALQIAGERGLVRLQLDVLLGVTKLFLNQEAKTRAVERLTLILHHPASYKETNDRAKVLLAKLSTTLPPEVFQSSQANGRVSRLDEAIKSIHQALELSGSQAADSDVQEVSMKRQTSIHMESDLLTERELEVLHLMARGMTNREIADKLVLSVGTIKWYGSQICGKLQAQNRVQAIVRARELNILP